MVLILMGIVLSALGRADKPAASLLDPERRGS
jgi:hypothetical protein